MYIWRREIIRTETCPIIIAWVSASLPPNFITINIPIAGNGKSRLILTFSPVLYNALPKCHWSR